MQSLRLSFTAALAFSVTACGSGGGGTIGLGPSGERTYEEYCNYEGLAPSKRHTYILIDERTLVPSRTAEEFIANNAAVRNAVQSFSSPSMAVGSAMAEPRERVSLFLLPADGTSASRIFTGCIPALSSEELADLRSEQSEIRRFATGDVARGIEEAQGLFEGLVVAAVRGASESVAESLDYSDGAIQNASAFRSLRASGRLVNTEEGLPRVVLISQLNKTTLPEESDERAMRRSAIEAARESRIDFGLSDVFVIQPSGADDEQQAFVETFFLAQNGRLSYWGDQRPPTVDAAPENILRFIGTADYPSGPETIQVRIATDPNGRLVQSWLVLRGQPDRATPLTGQAVCSSATSCDIRSDDGAFAQAWSLSPGGDPEFVNSMPFGGLRDFSITASDSALSGKIYDPAVNQIGSNPDKKAIEIEGTQQDNAVF